MDLTFSCASRSESWRCMGKGDGSRADSLKDMPDLGEAQTPLEAARNGLRFYKELQADDGHFATEYGGT